MLQSIAQILLGKFPYFLPFKYCPRNTWGQNTLMSGEYIGYGDNPYIQNRGSGLRAIYDFSEKVNHFL